MFVRNRESSQDSCGTGAVSCFMVVDLPGAGDGDDDGNYGDEDDDEVGVGDEDDDAVLILLPNSILFSLFSDTVWCV